MQKCIKKEYLLVIATFLSGVTIALCSLFLTTISSAVYAQERPGTPALSPATQEPITDPDKITLELVNMEIIDVLKLVARKGKFNLIIGRNVRGQITVFLENVSVWEALKIIFDANDLAYIKRGNIIQVITTREYEALYGMPFMDKREVKVVKLEYTKAIDMGQMLKQMNTKIGNIVINEDKNSLILIDVPETIARMENTIRELDVKTDNYVFKLKYLSVKDLQETIKPLLTKTGVLQADIPTNTLMVKDIPQAIASIKEVVETADTLPYIETKVFKLNYAKFDAVEAKVKEHLTQNVGKVVSDERTNKIAITDLPEKIAVIEPIIKELDEKSTQVLIEAKMVQVQLSDEFRLGINWATMIEEWRKQNLNFSIIQASPVAQSNVGNTLTDHVSLVDGYTSNKYELDEEGNPVYKAYPFKYKFPVSTARPGVTIIGSGTMNNNDKYTMVLNMLKHVGKANLLSSPRVLVLSGNEAKMRVGREEPIITTTTIHGDKISTNDNVTNQPVGIELTVKPIINEQKLISMTITPSISSVAGYKRGSGENPNTYPIVENQKIETSVIVKDGCTIIMGGLIQTKKDRKVNKIPVLGSLPLVGVLFRQTFQETTNNELVVFLTPHIINPDMNNATVPQNFSRFLDDVDGERGGDEIAKNVSALDPPRKAKKWSLFRKKAQPAEQPTQVDTNAL